MSCLSKVWFRFLFLAWYQKNPRVHHFLCPQFWGRKWLRRFYGHLEKLRSFCRKTAMPIKFLVLGGGVFGFFFGGVCRFYFYGREDFSDEKQTSSWKSKSLFASRPIKISKKTGTQRVRARYSTILPPFISIVRSPGRPVILVPEFGFLPRRPRHTN